MSIVTYNDITLPYALNTAFSQEATYEESGTDWYVTTYDITVQCLINKNYLDLLSPELAAAGFDYNPADIMAFIYSKLMQPRRQLSMTFNGTELIPNIDQQGTVDAQNGPQPKSCNYTMLTNSTFMMTFHIVAKYWISNRVESLQQSPPVSNQPGNPVLYNRWSETTDINNCMFTKRTRSGKYVIRSDNRRAAPADIFRDDMAVLGVPTGFLRESSNYTVAPDGLAVSYTIVDIQVFKYPPNGAYEASGTYRQRSVSNGAQRFGEVNVKLKGAPNTPQHLLIAQAIEICSAKLQINGALLNIKDGQVLGFAMIENCDVSVDMYENTVECFMRSRMLPSAFGKKTDKYGNAEVWTVNLRNMAVTPQSEPGTNEAQPKYAVRGQYGLIMQAAAYFDPSLSQVVNPKTGQLNQGLQVGQAGLVKE